MRPLDFLDIEGQLPDAVFDIKIKQFIRIIQ